MPNLFEMDSIVTYWANIQAAYTPQSDAYGIPTAQTDREAVRLFQYDSQVTNESHYMAIDAGKNENILGTSPNPQVRIPGGFTP